MKRQFLSVVPRSVQVWAVAIAAATVLIGLVAGGHAVANGAVLKTLFVYAAASLATGVFVAIWLLCLGFVFADARRRGMPAIGWTLVAMLMPNLLGFLLYFVMRRPVDQPFCSWCGSSRSQLPSRETTPGREVDPLEV